MTNGTEIICFTNQTEIDVWITVEGISSVYPYTLSIPFVSAQLESSGPTYGGMQTLTTCFYGNDLRVEIDGINWNIDTVLGDVIMFEGRPGTGLNHSLALYTGNTLISSGVYSYAGTIGSNLVSLTL